MPQFDSQTQVQIMDQLNKMHATIAYDIMGTVNTALERDEEISSTDRREIYSGIQKLQNDLQNLTNTVASMKQRGEDLRSIEQVAKKMYQNVDEMKSILNKGNAPA